jgi:hypothetical protein
MPSFSSRTTSVGIRRMVREIEAIVTFQNGDRRVTRQHEYRPASPFRMLEEINIPAAHHNP